MYDAFRVIETLEAHGYPSYLVGGAVRDLLLGIEPVDYDIATAARPEEVRRLFSDAILKYCAEFGNVTLPNVDITTFRRDEAYLDHRHPSRVVFVDTIEEDLRRRDFTICAMAYSEKRGLIDPYGGKRDLLNRRLVMVGNPYEKLSEDALRILRGIRFAAQFRLAVDKDFIFAARKEARFLNPNMQLEWSKILMGDHIVRACELMEQTGALEMIFPSVAKMKGLKEHGDPQEDILRHSFNVLAHMPCDFMLRLAALYHESGKAEVNFLGENGDEDRNGYRNRSEELFRLDMKGVLSRKKIDRVAFLIRNHGKRISSYSEQALRQLVKESSLDDVKRFIKLERAIAETMKRDTVFLGEAMCILQTLVI